MNQSHPLRRVLMTCASFALLTAPFGCYSETPAPPVAATPDVSAGPANESSTASAEAPAVIDKDVQQATHVIKGEAEGLKSDATQAADDVKDIEQKARDDAKKAADEAKGKVHDARNGLKKTLDGVKDEANRRVQAAEGEVKKSAEGAIDNLLGNPK